LSVTIDTAAPAVTGVLAASTAWTAAFLTFLQSNGLGVGGFSVPVGAAQLLALPWNNVNQLRLVFGENVSVVQNSLSVRGVSVADYATGGFAYDAPSRTAAWTLAANAGADKLLLDLNGTATAAPGAGASAGAGALVTDLAGNALDGEWANGAAAEDFPSGNGTAGGDFEFRINVLPGDASGDGATNVTDLGVLATNFNQGPRGPRQGDFNGDAMVNVTDLGVLATNFNRGLPAGSPSLVSPSASAAGRTRRPAAAVLFGTGGIRPATRRPSDLDELLG
jgi:hypothetical protein